jgi:hypothetical protein
MDHIPSWHRGDRSYLPRWSRIGTHDLPQQMARSVDNWLCWILRPIPGMHLDRSFSVALDHHGQLALWSSYRRYWRRKDSAFSRVPRAWGEDKCSSGSGRNACCAAVALRDDETSEARQYRDFLYSSVDICKEGQPGLTESNVRGAQA